MAAERERVAQQAERARERRVELALNELLPIMPQLTLEQCVRALEVV